MTNPKQDREVAEDAAIRLSIKRFGVNLPSDGSRSAEEYEYRSGVYDGFNLGISHERQRILTGITDLEKESHDKP